MYMIFKRIIDILAALVALPFLLVILIVIAPLIHFTDGGPVFYNAPRVGKNFRKFKMYKFRSMKVNAPDIRNADGSTFNSEKDPRVTKIGKFIRKTSIDELPQIINVLTGEMSLIGPRPSTPMVLEKQDDEILLKRFLVKPGITGYTQALYRNNAQGENRYNHDLYYVRNLSFLLDIKIFFWTIKTVIEGKNIYNKID